MQPNQQQQQQEQQQQAPGVVHLNAAAPLYEKVSDIFTEAEFASFMILMQSRGLDLHDMREVCNNIQANYQAAVLQIDQNFMAINPRYHALVTLEGYDQLQNIGGPENQQIEGELSAQKAERRAEIKANAIEDITAMPPVQPQAAGRRNRNRRRVTRRSRSNRRSTRRRFFRR